MPLRRSAPRRYVSLYLLVLVSIAVFALSTQQATATRAAHDITSSASNSDDSSDSSEEPPSCSTRGECCQLCGADSVRCARGPCSDAFLTKSLFSFSLSTTDVGFWDIAFAFYGMVPYLVFAAITLEMVARRRFTWTRVFAFCFIPIVSVLTSSILVKSLGHCAECARPCGSCIKSTGMPSGHTTNAVGYCLWVILEVLIGLGRRWPVHHKALAIAAAVLLFAPVPYSRLYLGDHTVLQVAIGSANGVVLGLVYFALLRVVVAKRLDRASQWLARGRFPVRVVNDYSPKPAPVLAGVEVEPVHAVALELAYVQVPVTPPVHRIV